MKEETELVLVQHYTQVSRVSYPELHPNMSVRFVHSQGEANRGGAVRKLSVLKSPAGGDVTEDRGCCGGNNPALLPTKGCTLLSSAALRGQTAAETQQLIWETNVQRL